MSGLIRTYVHAHPRLRERLRAARRAVAPLREGSAAAALARYPRFAQEYRRYVDLGGEIRLLDLYPRLHDRTSLQGIDPHYFHQAAWAMTRVAAAAPAQHVDVGSETSFVGMLTAVTNVCYVDIRPVGVRLPRFEERVGSVLDLPFETHSLESVSCLHVAEHVGLARYGDPLDPEGTVKAALQLQRVLAVDGDLLFSLPVGRERVEFNAHRVHSVERVVALFPQLTLKEFSIVTDDAELRIDAPTSGWDDQEYACGMFWFTRRAA